MQIVLIGFVMHFAYSDPLHCIDEHSSVLCFAGTPSFHHRHKVVCINLLLQSLLKYNIHSNRYLPITNPISRRRQTELLLKKPLGSIGSLPCKCCMWIPRRTTSFVSFSSALGYPLSHHTCAASSDISAAIRCSIT